MTTSLPTFAPQNNSGAAFLEDPFLSAWRLYTMLICIYLFCFLGIGLNLSVAYLSLFKKMDDGYRYLVALITGNNVFIMVTIMADQILAELVRKSVLFSFILYVAHNMPLTISTYQLVFTLTKVIAVWYPIKYQNYFTQQVYLKIAVSSFLSLYGVLAVVWSVIPTRLGYLQRAAAISLVMDNVNIIGCLSIFYKLKSAQQPQGDEEMRHAIRCNFIQCFIPYCLGFPGQLAFILLGPGVGGAIHLLANFSNQLIDPLSVLLTISAYRQALAAVIPASKRPYIIAALVIVASFMCLLSAFTTLLFGIK